MKICFLVVPVIFMVACAGTEKTAGPPFEEPVSVYYDSLLRPFYHGVASGDPLADRVIIWTRVTPETRQDSIKVEWEVSAQANFSDIVQSGAFTTFPDRDYTVKVDVAGLDEGTPYYYRFVALGDTSVAGVTKTASVRADSLRFAVVSCSNYEWGYFCAYRKIADRELLDAVVHLGDYIYEYEPGGYGDTTIGRRHLPAKELITLQDYRTRYSQYRLEPDLRAVHASHPFIAIWDDHEIANDTYETGAENHQTDEGAFDERKAAAVQTYFEWMPVREGDKLYRAFGFGRLADLVMLDERIAGRSKPLDSLSDPHYGDEQRTMLGKEQLDWLKDRLVSSDAVWKIIGNQVIFTDLYRGEVHPDSPRNLDSWDGYPAEKKSIAEFIREKRLNNTIFITGDTHASWVFETMVAGVSDDPLAVEFATPSISSSNYDEYTTLDSVKMAEQLYLRSNPHLKYVNLADHGYLLLTIAPDTVKAEFYYVETLRDPETTESLASTAQVASGSTKVQ